MLILSASFCFAQNNRKISGLVTDTAKIALTDLTVKLISGKDTLQVKTDEYGEFSFTKITAESFQISINAIGFTSYQSSFTFNPKDRHYKIPTIQLKFSPQMLKEVVIKSKPNPIRVMRDTVEYNAAAFQVYEGDNVADLLKQFSGLEVDGDYNVKTMGKDVVKLRVNGKDFFTSNPKDFLAKLPAEIVSKIQIIDDFGDEANFTGLKIGEPVKMINIVTKPGMNQGKFGSLSIKGGTNRQIGSTNSLNVWKDQKQTGGTLGYTAQDNGAGNSAVLNGSANIRNKLGKSGNFNINYFTGRSDNASFSEQVVETVSSLGNFYNFSQNRGENVSMNHNLGATFSVNKKIVYINGNINAGYNTNNNQNFSNNSQSGVIRQDFRNSVGSKNRSPRIDVGINASKRMKDNRDLLSSSISFNTNSNNSSQNIQTNTLYYNQQTGALVKDSLLNRIIDNSSNNLGFSFQSSYTVAISKPKDTTGTRSISFNYSVAVNDSKNEALTSVLSNQTSKYTFVDSLSSSLSSISINQTLATSYHFSNPKTRLSLGFQARPLILSNFYQNLQQKVVNKNFNYAPTFNFNRTLNPGKILSLSYNGYNSNPQPYQLQPVRNTQNLQNIIVGNPALKPSFSHTLNANYNYVHIKTGTSMFVTTNFSATQNQIVNNVVVIPDTLGSFRQETRYENTNGTYNLSGNYSLSKPIVKSKFSMNYGGSLGVSNRALFINNVRNFNKGLNLSQTLGANVTLKKFNLHASFSFSQVNNNNVLSNIFSSGLQTFNIGQLTTTDFFKTRSFNTNLNSNLRLAKANLRGNASYNVSKNSSASMQESLRTVKTLDLSFNGDLRIWKTYQVTLTANKRYNTGFALNNVNPLLINVGMSKQLLKNRALSINLSGNDLLNQGNNLSRTVSGNSVIDSRTNLITRVFSFGLSYNVSKFGPAGKTIRVDPD